MLYHKEVDSTLSLRLVFFVCESEQANGRMRCASLILRRTSLLHSRAQLLSTYIITYTLQHAEADPTIPLQPFLGASASYTRRTDLEILDEVEVQITTIQRECTKDATGRVGANSDLPW